MLITFVASGQPHAVVDSGCDCAGAQAILYGFRAFTRAARIYYCDATYHDDITGARFSCRADFAGRALARLLADLAMMGEASRISGLFETELSCSYRRLSRLRLCCQP